LIFLIVRNQIFANRHEVLLIDQNKEEKNCSIKDKSWQDVEQDERWKVSIKVVDVD